MFNLIIHSNPYRKTNQIIDPYINISAKNKYAQPTNTKQSKGLSNE
jgi:hypothetical protein